MKIRLHLVRFMYINLVLSCCFWVYDNAAAADVSSPNAATTKTNNNEGGSEAEEQVPMPVSMPSLAPDIESPLHGVANSENNPTKESAATTIVSTPTTSSQDADKVGLKVGNAPIANAETEYAAETDTSVNINALPPDVNFNKNKENSSVVPNSEKSNNAGKKTTANVPKNQLNIDNNNNNIYVADSVEVNQLANTHETEISAGEGKPNPTIDQQQPQQQQQKESLPDIITDVPVITVAELPVELGHVKEHLETSLPHEAQDPSNKSEQHQTEAQVAEKAELNINDPGGGVPLYTFTSSETNVEANVTGDEGIADGASKNVTAEEVPMPVFSEWAQKQIEAEASREQAMELEQQVVNTSAQRRDAAGSGSGKAPPLKLRAKNYASPDCGAKIIASNADATNTGAVLSHSSDEYMLSTCGSRIWFVVELCEAVQAQKVELANFELFSSSPKNFTVAVSKRFPTRDWSNVGRFAAEDKRTVQTFELHPHLFGKFVRVDVHSHYSKEHFCPISLFRVFGTSEFEAFETEIRHSDELDDFDDDFGGQEQQHKTGSGTDGGGANIFQSASDAVIQMVKKAAQVLVKPTKALRWSSDSVLCHTPTVGMYSCQNCNNSVVDRINNLLSCQSQQLQQLLVLPQLRTHLMHTRICQDDYDISFGLAEKANSLTSGMDKRQSFYLSVLPAEHVGAMCKLLQAEYIIRVERSVEVPVSERPMNTNSIPSENVSTEASTQTDAETRASSPEDSVLTVLPTLEIVTPETSSSTEVPVPAVKPDPQPTESSEKVAPPSDVNIFNVPTNTQKDQPQGTTPLVAEPTPAAPTTTPLDSNEVEGTKMPAATPTSTPAQSSSAETDNGDLLGSGNGLDDSNLSNWESIDSLLTTTVASITAGGGAAAAAAAVVNGNTHIGGTGTAGTAGASAGLNLQPKLTHGPQSESVFIRLSNRIKALERNMSLSGQYLEELSRRYKKQVEELQQTLTQQTLTVRTLEDQSRRLLELEQQYQQQSAELAGEVRALTYQVQTCILVIIIVGTCIFLMLVMGTVLYRKRRRQTHQLLPQASATTKNLNRQKLCRRKSYEDMPQQSPGKQRRPSEEAMLILKGCGDSTHVAEPTDPKPETNGRQRKISVCYGSNNNISSQMLGTRSSLHRRKGVKHSWHASLDSSSPLSCGEQLDKFFDVDTLKNQKQPTKSGKKKSQQSIQQELKRQESAPANCTQGSLAEEATQSDFDESLILDDDDLCNFIPNSDLAYNEFMPEGPSGYQILDTVDGKTDKTGQASKKFRRVSSPAFFKSPFSKSRNKDGSTHGIKASQSAHEATSWEWYRLKRSDKQSKHSQVPVASISPNASLDNSSLSEVSFPFNSTQNSFRILGEAIGKSGAAAAGSSSSSGASTTSSTTKKKQRTFNNIFRKVF